MGFNLCIQLPSFQFLGHLTKTSNASFSKLNLWSCPVSQLHFNCQTSSPPITFYFRIRPHHLLSSSCQNFGGHFWQWFLHYTPDIVCHQSLSILGPQSVFLPFFSPVTFIVQTNVTAHREYHGSPFITLFSSVSSIFNFSILFMEVKVFFNKNRNTTILPYQCLPFTLRVGIRP